MFGGIVRDPRKRSADAIIGQTFGRLLVLKNQGSKPGSGYQMLCRCECGREKVVSKNHLTNGDTRSCGCFHADRTSEISKRHGLTGTPIYARWRAMLQRCINPKNKSWENYGGRGITVCERWKTFDNFYADMGDPPLGATIERIDNNGSYEPGNCRWDTRTAQNRNQRQTVWLEYDGQVKPLTSWADDLGMPASAIRDRLKRGWSVERAVTTPRQSAGNPRVRHGSQLHVRRRPALEAAS